ncbi:MAG: (d)CMP kinase [Clostridia bacterium]|nr:(d)CMP kinase [Clostridia bacterium]
MNCIAIDGPAGSGKTTAAKMLAVKMGYYYLNTGALYRAFAYQCLEMKIDINNTEKVISCIDEINIDVKFEGKSNQRVIVNGKDVTDKLSLQNVEQSSSIISSIKEVREKMTKAQQNIAKQLDFVVVEGRDIGTVVVPDSKFKFFLTASVEERARRVANRLKESGVLDFSLKQIEIDIMKRDERDINRKISPLRKADDAIEINSTFKNPEEVVDEMYSYIAK